MDIQLMCNKGTKAIQWGKDSVQQMVLGYTHWAQGRDLSYKHPMAQMLNKMHKAQSNKKLDGTRTMISHAKKMFGLII